MSKVKRVLKNARVLAVLAVIVAAGTFWATQRSLAGTSNESTESLLQTQLTQGDAALEIGRYPDAFAAYLSCLDLGRTVDSSQTLVADGRVEEIWRKVPDLPEADLDAIQAQWPAWNTLQTPRAKAWEMRFVDSRRRKFAAAGAAVEADAATRAARDMAWDLIEQHPADPVIRKALQVYLDMNDVLGERATANRVLADYAATLPPCVAKFCITYWFAQDARKADDTRALKARCRELVDIYEQGGITEALNDPFGNDVDKLLMDYHVAYAYFMVSRPAESLAFCDYILAAYAEVRDTSGRTHGGLIQTALLRPMVITSLHSTEPAKSIEAYDEFLDKYPDDPNGAKAWLAKGMLYERLGDHVKAAQCHGTVIAQFPDSEERRLAQEYLDLLQSPR